MSIILFIYGLSFFSFGLLVLFAQEKNSELFFANKIWYLGIFAILHSFVEWIALYKHVYSTTSSLLLVVELTLLLLSYIYLFEFSRFIIRKNFENPNSKWHFIYNFYSAPVIYLIAVSMYLVILIFEPSWFEMIIATRYTFGFWGSLLLGLGLYYYADLKTDEYMVKLSKYFKMLGIIFMIYAFFAGLIVPPSNFLQAKYLNSLWFFETFHIPVEVCRTMCAVLIALLSMKALKIFQHERDEKLRKSYEKVKEFTSNVSHQLKTPLAAIKIQTDVILQKERDSDEYKKTLHNVLSEITILDNLIEDLLMLSKIDNNKTKESFEQVEIDTLMIEIISEYIGIAQNRGVCLDVGDINSLTISGNKALLSILLTNLLDNGIKYTPSKKKVKVTISNNSLIIEDEGVGIPKEEQDCIFNKFFRSSLNRKSDINGYGLGLFMSKKIAALHGISIFLVSEVGKGSTFTLKF